MPTVVITADVDDAAKWEQNFRTHGKLFRDQTVKKVKFAVTGENQVACSFKVKDLDTYKKLLESDLTADAMRSDGVRRDIVLFFLLVKSFLP